MDIFSIFVTIAGFVIGLGAVTVIDIHGLLGKKSSYWTEATIRTHKVTKPLIWIGMTLLIVGHILLQQTGIISVDVIPWRFIIMGIMIGNGLFLSFFVSPELMKRETEGRSKELLPLSLQRKITVSFALSFLSWWGLLVALAVTLSN